MKNNKIIKTTYFYLIIIVSSIFLGKFICSFLRESDLANSKDLASFETINKELAMSILPWQNSYELSYDQLVKEISKEIVPSYYAYEKWDEDYANNLMLIINDDYSNNEMANNIESPSTETTETDLTETEENAGNEKNTESTGTVTINNDSTTQENAEGTTEAITTETDTENKTPEDYLAAISFQGTSYTNEQLNNYDFLVSSFYAIDPTTSLIPEELDGQKLLSMDMSIDLSTDDYKVLIYHTHGTEEYADSRPGVTEDTVIGVGDELARILEEKYGIKVYHDRNVYDYVNGVLDRSYAYDLSGASVDQILAEHPSIEVVIDLHRDGVDESVKLYTEIDGKPMAKIMFLNGVSRLNVNGDIDYLYNPYKIENLSFSLQMQVAGTNMYSDFLRRIYIRGYRFNLEKMPRATLIEVGAQTNTVQEAKNSMDPLATILYKVLSGK